MVDQASLIYIDLIWFNWFKFPNTVDRLFFFSTLASKIEGIVFINELVTSNHQQKTRISLRPLFWLGEFSCTLPRWLLINWRVQTETVGKTQQVDKVRAWMPEFQIHVESTSLVVVFDVLPTLAPMRCRGYLNSLQSLLSLSLVIRKLLWNIMKSHMKIPFWWSISCKKSWGKKCIPWGVHQWLHSSGDLKCQVGMVWWKVNEGFL